MKSNQHLLSINKLELAMRLIRSPATSAATEVRGVPYFDICFW